MSKSDILGGEEDLPIQPTDNQNPVHDRQFKQRAMVVEMVRQMESLSSAQKESLVQMIESEHAQIVQALESSSTVEELSLKLVQLVAAPSPIPLAAAAIALALTPTSAEQPPERLQNRAETEPGNPSTSSPFELALKRIDAANKVPIVTQSLKEILKLLQKLHATPSDPKNRKHRTDHLIIKKFIMGLQGGVEFLQLVGFQRSTIGGREYLIVEEADLDENVLSCAVNILSSRVHGLLAEMKEKEKQPARRVICAGGCGFWGEENREDMCSLCYKKKYLGSGAVKVEAKAEPTRCTKGCGFWATKDGMCSKCWTEENKNKPKVKHWRAKLKSSMIKLRAMRRFKLLGRRQLQKDRTKCFQCRRKVGLLGIECRCGFIFCGKHRYADEHDCSFDFKKAFQEKLRKENMAMVDKKMDRIDDAE